MQRSAAIVAATGLVLAGAVTLTTTPADAAVVGCRAVYTVSSQWPSGFAANVAVTNLGDPLSNWVITWDFGGGQQVTSGWNAAWSQSSAHVKAASLSWNGPLGTGQTVNVGFNGSWTGSNPIPTAIYLNGTLCTGTVSSTSPSASTGPGAPQAPRTAQVTETTVDLAWMPPPAGSNPVAAYDIYTSANAQPYQLAASTTTAGAYYTLTGLTAGTSYQIVVRARDTTGASGPPSNPPVAVTTSAAGTSPGAPVATAATSTTVTVTWPAPTADIGQVAGYEIVVPAASPTTPIRLLGRVTGSGTTTVTLTGLSPDTTYRAVVWAITASGAELTSSVRGTISTTP